MANLFPPASSTFETAGSTGKWNAWYGCTVAQSTEQAHSGTGSMKITPTGTDVGLMTGWPGIAVTVTGGVDYEVTVWAIGPSSSGTLTGSWKDSGATDIGTFAVNVASGPTWQSATTILTAPSGAESMYFNTDITSLATSTVYLDDLTMAEKAAATPAEVTTEIPLSLDLSASSEAEHAVSADVPLSLALAATTETVHEVTADIPLSLAVQPTTDAPTVAATVTTEIPLSLALTASAETRHEAAAQIPLTVALAATTDAPLTPGTGRDLTILRVGAPASAWKAGILTSDWSTTAPKATWQTSTPAKRWATTTPTRTDPS